MPREPKQFSRDDDPLLQRAIVTQILRADHAERWSQAELAVEIGDAATPELRTAIGRLHHAGVLVRAGETVRASRCTKHLDELELIAI
jgi:hypothetical protein